MGKSTKTANPMQGVEAAQSEYVFNKQNAAQNTMANRPNQYNQFGNSTWAQDANGNWTQTTSLNEPQQNIFNQQQANQQQIANAAGGMLGGLDTSQIDLSQAPAMAQVGQFNQQATDLYNQLAAPELERSQNAQRARAAAMGIPEFGSQAGTTMNQQLADAASRSAMMGAQAGIQQGNTMFGQQNQLHQQGVQDILNQRTANLGQISGLMGVGQQMGVPQFENFTAATNAPNLNIASGLQQSAQDQANAKNMDKSNTMGAVGKIAGAALSFL